MKRTQATSSFSKVQNFGKADRNLPLVIIAIFIMNFIPCFLSEGEAQNIGINSTGASPNSSAALDIDMSNKGLLIPRVALASVSDAAAITSPATSLLVYNTGGALTPEGYYYNQGTPGSPNWVPFLTNNVNAPAAWSLTGNTGTTVGTHFLGTTDTEDFAIYTNNTERMRVDQMGNVGIGTTSPEVKLHVVSDDANNGYILLDEASNTAGHRPALVTRRSRGTAASPATIADGDIIGEINYQAYDGTMYRSAGTIRSYVDGYTGTDQFGSNVIFMTRPNTLSTDPTERMRITANGNVGVGTISPAGKLHVSGAVDDRLLMDNGVILSSKNVSGTIRNLLTHYSDDKVYLDNPDGDIIIRPTGGNVGIGTTSPGARLDVRGNFGQVRIGQSGQSGKIEIARGSDGAYAGSLGYFSATEGNELLLANNSGGGWINVRTNGGSGGNVGGFRIIDVGGPSNDTNMVVLNTGNIGIGTTSPSAKLEVCGNTRIVGQIAANSSNLSAGLTCSSDKRLKKDISSIANPLAIIQKIEGKTYYWKSEKYQNRGYDNKKQFGFIAQQIEEVLPELVVTQDDGFKSVDYIKVIPILTEALKDLSAISEEQQQIIESQNSKIAQLESRYEGFKAENTEQKQNFEARIKKLEVILDQQSKK